MLGVAGVGDRRFQAILARNFSVQNWERQEERKNERRGLTLTGLLMEGIGSISCWENSCFLLMEVATGFEQALFCLSPKV